MVNLFFKSVLFFTALLLASEHSIYAQNKKTLDSLLGIYDTAKHDTIRVLILNKIASQYRTGKADTCIILAEKALAMGRKLGFERGNGEAYINIGFGNLTKGKYPVALGFFKSQSPFSKK